jgi:transcriptional regulator with XRE-family HTH domain
MFYDRFTALCRQKDVSPSRAAMDAGISKSLVSKWKNSGTELPSPEVLTKLSRYFGVPVDALIDSSADPTAQKNTPAEFSLDEGEQLLLSLYRSLPEAKRQLVLQTVRAFAGNL